MFGRQYIRDGTIVTNWVPTIDQRADVMTKILDRFGTERHCTSIGLMKGRIKGEITEKGKSSDQAWVCVLSNREKRKERKYKKRQERESENK